MIRLALLNLRGATAELAANKEAVSRMDDLVKSGRVTLLYAAHDTEHNEARVLADYLKARVGRL